MPNCNKPYTCDRVNRIIFAVILIGIAIYLINYLSSVILPFCIACLIAYILEPIVQYNRKIFRIKGRFPAIALTLIETASVFTLLGYIFIPRIIEESQQMAMMFKQYATAKANIQYLPDEVHTYLRELIDFDKLSSLINQQNT